MILLGLLLFVVSGLSRMVLAGGAITSIPPHLKAMLANDYLISRYIKENLFILTVVYAWPMSLKRLVQVISISCDPVCL